MSSASAPERLFKYRSLIGASRKHTESLFRHCEIYFAPPGTFDDPFDCKVHFTFPTKRSLFRKAVEADLAHFRPDLTRQQRRDMATEIVNDKRPERNRMLQDQLTAYTQEEVDQAGVFCLAEEPDNTLLWSHYADSHRGFCLQFQRRTLGHVHPVDYREHRPQVDYVLGSTRRQVHVTLLTKAAKWSYQREWRMIDLQHGAGVRTFPPTALSAVIFGYLMPASDRDAIRQWVQAGPSRPAFLQALGTAGAYDLKIVPDSA